MLYNAIERGRGNFLFSDLVNLSCVLCSKVMMEAVSFFV